MRVPAVCIDRMSQTISSIREEFKNEISRIVREHTDKDSLEDFEKGDRITIDGGEVEDLSVSKNHGGNFNIAQYVNGNARKPDMMVRIDMADLDLKFVEFQGVLKKKYVDNEHQMIELIEDWTNTLSTQF